MSRTPSLILLLASAITIAGCGAESIGTAAVVAEQKQQEIEEAQKLKESVVQQLDAAQAQEAQRLKELENH
jgi:hypothetical protein